MAQIRWAIAFAMLSTAAAAQTAQPSAIVDTPEFMTLLLKPAYVDVQRAVEKPPANFRAEWAATYQKAVRLAETANLVHSPARRRRHADWAERSAAARDAGAAVADAVLVGLRAQREAAGFRAGHNRVRAGVNGVQCVSPALWRDNAPTIRD